MILNKNSWHYGFWAQSYQGQKRPESTNLCGYCQRVFWVWLVYAILVAGALVSVFGFIWIAYRQPLIFFMGISCVVGAAAFLAALIIGVEYLHRKWSQTSEPQTLVGKWLRAIHQGVCPTVDFTDEK
jgi:hypothetical protein